MLEEILNSDKCTGCKICSNVCPESAISYVEDDGGFWYPQVDNEKCIECGLCEKKCPILNDISSNKSEPEVYVTWSKDEKVRLNSTSGGICYELSKYVIDHGGYVAGVTYSDDFKSAHYIIVNDMEGLKKITQTKYFQADPEKVYSQIRMLLDQGRKVMFVGTPCYNAALCSYLGKEYDNLVQCEFICRGNPSPRLHKLHIEYLEEKYNSRIVLAHSKNKKKGWSCFGTYCRFENGKEYYKDRWHHPMTVMFIGKNLNSRESCFDCHYRKVPRMADITVGDFWGIKGVTKKDLFNGCSVMMLNSNKGRRLFQNVQEAIAYEKRTLEEVASGNPALYQNVESDGSRKEFFRDINEMPFESVVGKYVSSKDFGNPRLKGLLRKIKKFIKLAGKISWSKFFYYNFICRKVDRKRNCYLIPYSGSCIELHKGSKIILSDNFFMNYARRKGSRAESYLRINSKGKLVIKGRTSIAFNSNVSIGENGCLTIGKMETNVNCNIVCANSITIGNDVVVGRDVTIYDSNYHTTKKTKRRSVVIGDHVWIGTRSIIMEGSKIGNGAIISVNSWVTGKVKEKTMVSGPPANRLMENVEWKK